MIHVVEGRLIIVKRAWTKVIAQQTDDEVFEAKVVAVNRGGAICLVEGLCAFLPGSHLTGQLPTEELIGQTLPLKFLEVNQEDNKLVLSNHRAVVEQQMSDLSRGDIIGGLVKALKPYGAFVEVGGMSGLLHILQISYDRIEDLEKVLQPGQQVKCIIIDHDKVNRRIALSTKTLEPEPGDMLRDSARVFELAEETAKKYHERMEAERKAREEAAKDWPIALLFRRGMAEDGASRRVVVNGVGTSQVASFQAVKTRVHSWRWLHCRGRTMSSVDGTNEWFRHPK